MTVEELTKIILSRAKRGAYRKDIYNEYRGTLSYGDMAKAFTLARGKGLYSVSDMRDFENGTYYQYDVK